MHAITLGFYAGPRIQVFMLIRQLVTKPFPQPCWLLLPICTEVRISRGCLGAICVAEANGCSQLYILSNIHMRFSRCPLKMSSLGYRLCMPNCCLRLGQCVHQPTNLPYTVSQSPMALVPDQPNELFLSQYTCLGPSHLLHCHVSEILAKKLFQPRRPSLLSPTASWHLELPSMLF